MQQRVQLGPCGAIRHHGDATRCAMLLPALFYPTRASALWFAREAALAGGWSALELLGEPGEHAHRLAWERECAERALAAVGSARVLVIGKSLASLLARSIGERDLAAVWLTPLLGERAVIEALARARCPTLLIGGTADAAWQAEAIPNNHALEVVQLPGVDHALQVPGDPLPRSTRCVRSQSQSDDSPQGSDSPRHGGTAGTDELPAAGAPLWPGRALASPQ